MKNEKSSNILEIGTIKSPIHNEHQSSTTALALETRNVDYAPQCHNDVNASTNFHINKTLTGPQVDERYNDSAVYQWTNTAEPVVELHSSYESFQHRFSNEVSDISSSSNISFDARSSLMNSQYPSQAYSNNIISELHQTERSNDPFSHHWINTVQLSHESFHPRPSNIMNDTSLNISFDGSSSLLNSQYPSQVNSNSIISGSQENECINDSFSHQWTNYAHPSFESFQSGLSNEMSDISMNSNRSFVGRSSSINSQYQPQESASNKLLTSPKKCFKNLQKILNFLKG